jgi:hypothetical protein
MNDPRDEQATAIDAAKIADALARLVELVEEIAAALARIEERQERTNELLDRIDKTQWS